MAQDTGHRRLMEEMRRVLSEREDLCGGSFRTIKNIICERVERL